jgi:hypothetical protein
MLQHERKVQYGKIEARHVVNEHAAEPKASERKPRSYYRVRTNFLNSDASFDTVEVSKRLKEILLMHRIDFGCFARWKLYVSSEKFAQLLSQSKEWASLSMTDKKTYARMQKWSLATEEEILGLEKSLTDRRRHYKDSKLRLMVGF